MERKSSKMVLHEANKDLNAETVIINIQTRW